jgi:hypothetical protein
MFKPNDQPRPQGFFAELLNSDATAVDSSVAFVLASRVRGLVDWSYGGEGMW